MINKTNEKIDIFGMPKDLLIDNFLKFDMKKYRATQVMDWLYKKHIWDFEKMENIKKEDRLLLLANFSVLPNRVKLLTSLVSQDQNTEKLLIELKDSNTIETVGMKHRYGNSICVSSQVGCAMSCAFCASTLNGLTRNLSAAEMLLQVALFQEKYMAIGSHVSNIVVMGSGEPLKNYDELIKFLHLVHDTSVYEIGYRHITVSTCGIIENIEKLSNENLPISLAISLHATDDETRDILMPINKKYRIKNIIDAGMQYAEKTKRQVMYEYLLIDGLNDSEKNAAALGELLKNSLSSVNIIPVNDIPERGWKRPSQEKISLFFKKLHEKGIVATVRREMGSDIAAACGQLKAGYKKKKDIL